MQWTQQLKQQQQCENERRKTSRIHENRVESVARNFLNWREKKNFEFHHIRKRKKYFVVVVVVICYDMIFVYKFYVRFKLKRKRDLSVSIFWRIWISVSYLKSYIQINLNFVVEIHIPHSFERKELRWRKKNTLKNIFKISWNDMVWIVRIIPSF